MALALWARRLDALLALPVLQSAAGIALLVPGVLLALWATVALWTQGHGLPASAFPPERLVTGGPYALVAHPIYVGTVAILVGLSLLTGSGAGLWVVSPVLAACAAAWVLGFERDLTRRRFGALPVPRIRLPDDSPGAPTAWQRATVYALVLLPWVVLYMAVDTLGPGPDVVSTGVPWERGLPVLPWTEIVYASVYPVVGLAPLFARTRRDLRGFARDGLVSMALVFPMYLVLPLAYVARPIPGDGLLQDVMQLERAADSAATAFPAYHVVWAVLALRVYAARWPRARLALVALALAIAASCVTTGMHSVADVVAAGVAVAVIARRRLLWRRLLDATEWVANSWREWTAGPVRFLNHGLYAGVGAALGVALQVALGGAELLPWSVAQVAAAIVGAAVWAQVVEGSPQLLRPYGYFGSVIGVGVVTLAAAAAGVDALVLFVSFGVGSTVTYAMGRLRCLVQGCCHGVPCARGTGIVYSHPRTRVVRLSAFGGVPIHPTPLYSLLWALLVGAALLRLWNVGAPVSFVGGAYFVLFGLGRFVEEHFRGEPQTRVIAGLRLYQWLAIAFVAGGAALTTLRSAPAPAPAGVGLDALPALVLVAIGASCAYGLDFPRSRRRFSRLV